ncbi:MAG: hypothetical protein CMN05_04530 [Roseibacillus sp.]|nr:hypothetical protein [Roseibacillus sp.]MBP35535.1 hypothetical protein [Roseibacillus sp.]MCP4731605.1 hypothetical protein [Roseibacillus sp.]MDP7308056.1 hypothetical protein [Roseibacillus sp.]MDP7497455.1 hypothetical protein [Roseibacillus sp.]
MRNKHLCLCLLLAFALGPVLSGCSGRGRAYKESRNSRSWTRAIKQELQALGYRNWVVIGDAAFPLHSRPGVRTIFIDDEIPVVLQEVLDELERVQNVSPRIYLARELAEIPNDRAPGIEQYRRKIEGALRGYPAREMEFRSLSLLLEDSANKFTVLVFKTSTALPYSGIFIELDSGYWDPESERNMRERLEKKLRIEST